MEIDSTEVVELIIDVRAAGSGVEGGLAMSGEATARQNPQNQLPA